MSLSVEQQDIVNIVLRRAEQACRYALKHQSFSGEETDYAMGWTAGAEICEGAIHDHVMRHIEKDLTDIL